MPPEVDRWAYSSRVVEGCDGAMSMPVPVPSRSLATKVSGTLSISPWDSGSTGMMSTRPVRACAVSGWVVYRVESRPGHTGRDEDPG